MPSNKPPKNYGEAVGFLVRMNLEPIWNEGPLFKKIAGRRGYKVTGQSHEQI